MDDKYNAIYLICVLYGVSMVQPFNAVFACLDYYATTVSSEFKSNLFITMIDARFSDSQYMAIRHQWRCVADNDYFDLAGRKDQSTGSNDPLLGNIDGRIRCDTLLSQNGWHRGLLHRNSVPIAQWNC